MTSPKLEAPPITEVVCGVYFAPVPGLDPISVGDWWRELKSEYPKHAIQPGLSDAPAAIFGALSGIALVRSWLISADDDWVIQVQADRFYVNWRKKSGPYPRFSDHDGRSGVLTRALHEFARFETYCSRALGVKVVPTSIDLAKVDLIIEGEHWKGPDVHDLGVLLPLIRDVARFTKTGGPELALRLSEPRPNGLTTVALSLATEAVGPRLVRAAKIETRTVRGLVGPVDLETLRTGFSELNEDANRVFFGFLNQAELARFAKRDPK